MAIRSGLFNSVNGDRRYKADFFAEYFASFIANGVFPNPSTGLQVLADQNMTVAIKPGKAWINGYFFVNDSDYILTIDNADGVLNRIDRIVLQLNYLNREIVPVIKKGTFARSPVAPSLQRDADAYELALADVLINNGATQITQANITDLRLNNELCGIVHGTVDQVDTTTIFNQYTAWFNSVKDGTEQEISDWQQQVEQTFNDWFDTVKGILEGDVATNLANRIATLEQDFASHQADYVKHPAYAVASGSANNYVVTLNPAPTSYVEGMAIAVKINVDNTGAATINVNGLGAKAIKKPNGNDVSAGNLKAGSIYTLRYNGTNFILQGEGGSGNAQPGDVLSGKTFTNGEGEQTGTMPDRGAMIITPTTTDQAIPAGYHNGNGVVKGDADLIPANIKRGINIFGVTGTLDPAPNLLIPVYNQNRTTNTDASAGAGRVETKSAVAITIPNSFSVCEMTEMNFFLQATGKYTGVAGYNAHGQIQIKFRATGYTITVADLYVSGLLYSNNKQASFTSLLLIASNGQCKVQRGGANSSEIPSSIQTFNNAGIDPSSGIDLLAYSYCDTIDRAFWGYAQVGPSGTIKAY